jgi:cell division protein FtsQ
MIVYSAHSQKGKSRRLVRPKMMSARKVGTLLLISTTALLILLKLATWLYAEELFLLKEIKIEGTYYANDDELLQLVAVDSGQNLFKCDLKKITASLQQHPLLEKVSVKRILPSTLFIQVQEYEPIASYSKDGLTALDNKGHLLKQIRPEMLVDQPIISNVSAVRPNDGSPSELEQVLEFLRTAKTGQFDLYARISEVSFTKEIGIYFYLTSHAIPVIVGRDDYGRKNRKLLKVIQIIERNRQLKNIEYFDLRFKNQVVVKEIS